ncbi:MULTISPECIES: MerR family transcriptional regulator [unclassified Epibacterium]|uniref:MerR family transcriptional regulator n=1 Tax=unclassified Epibacterium TaxID=2639179 RepID=UPI001EF67D76|nr:MULTISPECIES: MerR family transcriptional regulator [unclassified Epibacterium]MCG7624831.1 MerR family transcriptional regulator [Epibacterium sp. Ofav1-8]MCG7629521.1 MerR family transcriptional regulator [Epibacterium sp. MM17-32]
MRISQVAAKTGLSIDTLRFYEKIGLIEPPPRDGAGRRDYPEEVLGWIRFLAQLNATGMKQADRVRYARLRAEGAATVPERRRMLEAHRSHMQAQMQALEETLALMDRKVALYRDMEHKLTQESTDV